MLPTVLEHIHVGLFILHLRIINLTVTIMGIYIYNVPLKCLYTFRLIYTYTVSLKVNILVIHYFSQVVNTYLCNPSFYPIQG